jgi:hypothetical protein
MTVSANRICAFAACLVASAGVAHGATDVIFSCASGTSFNGATSIVPGAVDASGNPIVANFFQLNEFFLSPDGSTWIMRETNTQNVPAILTGNGLTGTVLLQKSRPFPGALAGETVNFFSALTGYPFNANNDFALGLRVSGNADSFMYKMLRYTGGVGGVRAQKGDLYTGSVGNVQMGSQIDSVHLRNNGAIGWRDSSGSPIAVYDEVKFLQSNVDSVMTLDGSSSVVLSSIAGNGAQANFLTSPDGSRVVVLATISGGSTTVVVVDGRIRAQVSQALPLAPSITPTSIDQIFLAPNNDWYLRGKYSGGAWATKNGTLIAKTGDAVGSDTWAAPFTFSGNLQNSFFGISGNSNGDWVLVGRSTNPNTDTDDVVVVNGQVVLREGDPVPIDLNNDGVLDTAQVGRGPTFSPAFSLSAGNTMGLAPDKTLYIVANLRSNTGQDISAQNNTAGPALLRIKPASKPVCCLSDYNGDGDIGTDLDIEAFFSCLAGNCCPTCPPTADFNCDGDIGTDADIESFFRVLAGGNC